MNGNESSSQPGSITGMIGRGVANKDDQTDLYRRYYHRVREMARRRVPRSAVADASDIVNPVMDSIMRDIREGRFSCKDREELEVRLAVITHRKATNLYHYLKRPTRHPSEKRDPEKIFESHPLPEEYRPFVELYYDQENTPQEIADKLRLDLKTVQERLAYIDRWAAKHRYQPKNYDSPEALNEVAGGESPLDVVVMKETLAKLDPPALKTVLLVLEGRENAEIAGDLNVTVRQVQRRLRRVREQWLHEAQDDQDEMAES